VPAPTALIDMLAPEITAPEPTALPALNPRLLARRLALPAALVAAAIVGVLLGAGRVHVFADTLRRALGVKPGWVAIGVAFESVSLLGYVLLLSLVAGRATPRIRVRESAQITLAGAAATRLLPTAGAGGAALALWTLRRTGLRSLAAARTLLTFLVILYSVFLTAIVVAGATLALGLVHADGPVAIGAIPAAGSVVAIGAALALARGRSRSRAADVGSAGDARGRRLARLRGGAHHVGDAVLDACRLVRSGDRRLLGAAAYWIFDAAVVWAALHAFGSAPAIPVVALAYFVGQVANTLPVPGSVSGGMAGVLVAFGVHAEVALPAVLAYRTIAIWLPLPAAVASIPGLRATVARWSREDAEPVTAA
jgi:putative heme transporter